MALPLYFLSECVELYNKVNGFNDNAFNFIYDIFIIQSVAPNQNEYTFGFAVSLSHLYHSIHIHLVTYVQGPPYERCCFSCSMKQELELEWFFLFGIVFKYQIIMSWIEK